MQLKYDLAWQVIKRYVFSLVKNVGLPQDNSFTFTRLSSAQKVTCSMRYTLTKYFMAMQHHSPRTFPTMGNITPTRCYITGFFYKQSKGHLLSSSVYLNTPTNPIIVQATNTL